MLATNIKNEYKCSVCGNKTYFVIPNIFNIKTAHSETPVDEVIKRILCKNQTAYLKQFETFETYACQDCLIKIDEYDLAYTNAEKVEKELINLISKSNDKKQRSDIFGISFKPGVVDTSNDCHTGLIESDDEANEDVLDTSNITYVAKCEICNVEFRSIEELSQHLHTFEFSNIIDLNKDKIENEENGEKTLELSGNFKSSGRILHCTECNKSFYSKTDFKEHMREHRKHKYKCQHCEKCFQSNILLEIHQAVHEGRSELECPHCFKTLSSKGAMVKHFRIHLQQYKYQCERCGKQFLHDTSFRMHMYAHDDTRKVSCKICQRQFRCTPHLNRHMRIHTGEKPYSCPICGRLFAQRYNMMMHYKSHDPNGGDHKCTICDQSFLLKKRLNEHLKLKHNMVTLETIDNKSERLKRVPIFGVIENNDTEINS